MCIRDSYILDGQIFIVEIFNEAPYMLLGYLLTDSTLYIFYGSTAIAIQLSLSFAPWSILAIITPPDSVRKTRKTVLVDIDYINNNIYLYFVFSIFLYRAAI